MGDSSSLIPLESADTVDTARKSLQVNENSVGAGRRHCADAIDTAQKVASPADALRLIAGAGVLALDLETCGPVGAGMAGALNPRQGRVRLISLHDGRRGLVLDCFEHPGALPAVVATLTQFGQRGGILIAHNAAFDLGFLWQAGLRDLPSTICTYLLSQLLTAGDGEGGYGFGPSSLQAVVHKYLGKILPKELQASDWSGPLSTEQVEYALRDVEVLPPLLKELNTSLKMNSLQRPYADGSPSHSPGVADVELRALPAFVWLSQSGVPFDQDAWVILAQQAARRKLEYAEQLDAQAPQKGADGLFGPVDRWNWDSPQQVADVFRILGAPLGIDYKGSFSPTTNDAALALSAHPLADVLRNHREQATLLKMFGPNWLTDAELRNGRLYPRPRQIGTVTGRMSYADPNCQQIPRAAGYHACFKAPPGRVLVKADYATLQMRIATLYARDVALLNVFAGDGDPHTVTAQRTLGTQDVSKAQRQIAKSQNFALLFGAGSEGLRIYAKTTYGITFSDAEAKQHRTAWLRAYPGIAKWHESTRKAKVTETRSPSGRRRRLHSYTPDTERLNSPVQALEADGVKLALALLWERRSQCPSACPVLAVHDEVVIEVDADRGEQAKAWLTQAMIDGMTPYLHPVPVKVAAKVTQMWGE